MGYLAVSMTCHVKEPLDPVGRERDRNEKGNRDARASSLRENRERDVSSVQSARPPEEPIETGHPNPRRDHRDADRNPFPVHVDPGAERRQIHDGRIRGFNRRVGPDDSSSAHSRRTAWHWRSGECRTLRTDRTRARRAPTRRDGSAAERRTRSRRETSGAAWRVARASRL